METLVQHAIALIGTIDWQSPVVFIVVAGIWLAVIGRWGILLLIVGTAAVGSVVGDFIIMNIHTSHEVVTLPVVIYCIGGLLVLVSAGVAFVRYMLV
jgi:hypothetical protein